MTGVENIFLAMFLLITQGAVDPADSWLEKGYRAACHMKASGVWASQSPLGDVDPSGQSYDYLLKDGQVSACISKER